jgi:hypothetical protein
VDDEAVHEQDLLAESGQPEAVRAMEAVTGECGLPKAIRYCEPGEKASDAEGVTSCL